MTPPAIHPTAGTSGFPPRMASAPSPQAGPAPLVVGSASSPQAGPAPLVVDAAATPLAGIIPSPFAGSAPSTGHAPTRFASAPPGSSVEPVPSGWRLVVPPHTDLIALSAAWFPQAAWVREPESPDAAVRRSRPVSGARFRGMVQEVAPLTGVLGLDWDLHLLGPSEVDAAFARAAGVPPEATAVLDVATTTRRPEPGSSSSDAAFALEPRVAQWLVAAARRAGGAIVAPDGSVTVPVHGGAPDLVVFSAHAIAPGVLVAALHQAGADARIDSAPGPDEGIAPYELSLPTEYDGIVRVSFARAAELPLALTRVPWREYGPFRYRVHREAPEGYGGPGADGLDRIARLRCGPLQARAARAVLSVAGGTLVDGDGFLVDDSRLRALMTTA